MTPTHAQRVADWLFAFADPSRWRMVRALSDGELSAGVWATRSRVRTFSLTKHAIVLCDAGIARYRRQGTLRLYSLIGPRVENGMLTLAAYGVTFTMRLSNAEPEAPAKKPQGKKK